MSVKPDKSAGSKQVSRHESRQVVTDHISHNNECVRLLFYHKGDDKIVQLFSRSCFMVNPHPENRQTKSINLPIHFYQYKCSKPQLRAAVKKEFLRVLCLQKVEIQATENGLKLNTGPLRMNKQFTFGDWGKFILGIFKSSNDLDKFVCNVAQ